MLVRGNHKSPHSELNSSALDKAIIKDMDHRWAWTLTIEYLQKKMQGSPTWGYRKMINKREGGTLYKKTRDPWILIPTPLRTICKQSGLGGITPTMLLWLLPAQYSTHDLSNAKQMDKKTYPYWKDRPGLCLPLDKCKYDNPIDMHRNNRRASLYLPEVNLWHHTHTRRIYDC